MAIELTPDESRVLGVLVEKELTTPDQYPLTLNAVVNGANQKNNRYPVLTLTDDRARAALIGLRTKGLVVQLDGHGQRTSKFRHDFGCKMGLNRPEVVLLAELLLRGPQTLGELRGRASRMTPLDSLETVRNVLGQLMSRPEPLVEQLPPAPGSRAERYAQLLCPDLHPEQSAGAAGEGATADEAQDFSGGAVMAGGAAESARPDLADRVAALEAQVAALRAAMRNLAAQLGAEDPFENVAPGA